MKINLRSGFQAGGSVWQWNGIKFSRIATCAECTWQGDDDDSKTVDVPDGFKGAVVSYYGVSPFTSIYSAELVGFTPAELNAPAPVCGWMSEASGVRSTALTRVDTFGTWATAQVVRCWFASDAELVRGGSIHPVSGEVLVQLPYEAGDQSADAYAVYTNSGQLISSVIGAGNTTPYPIKDGSRWEFTSPMEMQRKADDELSEAVRRGREMDNGEVLRHLRSSYRFGSNPLPSLRKRFGGTWTFGSGFFSGNLPDGAAVFESADDSIDRWHVVYVK